MAKDLTTSQQNGEILWWRWLTLQDYGVTNKSFMVVHRIFNITVSIFTVKWYERDSMIVYDELKRMGHKEGYW
jgi:hypothetical protein